jgi:hypothetical protein
MSDSFLNVTTKILAYGDRQVNDNPRLKFVDWVRDTSGLVVRNPRSESYGIAPGATLVAFNGIRTTSLGSNTAFSVALSPLDPSTYRFTWTGGTNPTLRIDRGLTLNANTVTFAVLGNNTVNVSVPSDATFDFTGVVLGDVVFIPHITTGDTANVLSVLNSGYWTVLGVTDSKHISLARAANQTFEAVSESILLTSSSQFQAYSASGVQVGDKVDISLNFATSTQKTYDVTNVTSTFFEVSSTSPLPPETGITPTAAGMIFYTDAKRFLYLETDQETCIRLNGSTDNSQRISPVEPSNPDAPGVYLKNGPVWSLSVINRSSVTANVNVFHAE